MMDSRNSSVQENPSHIAGVDCSFCGYRRATEGDFFVASEQVTIDDLHRSFYTPGGRRRLDQSHSRAALDNPFPQHAPLTRDEILSIIEQC